MRMRRPLTATLLAASLALSACGGGSSSDGADSDATTTEASGEASGSATTAPEGGSGKVEVGIADFKYDPAETEVEVGSTVTFSNEDSATHTATAKEDAPAAFDTGQINDGDAATVTFSEAGDYAYYCSIHDYMTGTIRVVE